MDATLHALGRILLNAVPTFFIVLFLVIYLRVMFFAPMARTLELRYDESEGARLAAEESQRKAAERISEYEQKLRAARGELYAEQEKRFRELEHEHAGSVARARREAEVHVARAQVEIAAEAAEARGSLEAHSSELADRIAERILQGHAA